MIINQLYIKIEIKNIFIKQLLLKTSTKNKSPYIRIRQNNILFLCNSFYQ